LEAVELKSLKRLRRISNKKNKTIKKTYNKKIIVNIVI